MQRFSEARRWLAAVLLAGAACVVYTVPAAADSVFFPNPVSPNGQHLDELYKLISIPALIVFLFVEAWILFVAIRYRRKRLGADYVPPQWHGNRRLEVAWTLIPLAIVLTIASLSFVELVPPLPPL